jgi:hypothetical protein
LLLLLLALLLVALLRPGLFGGHGLGDV